MHDNYKKLFSSLKSVELPHDLQNKILKNIAIRQKRSVHNRLFLSATTAIMSILGMLLAIQYTIQEFYLSNFNQYLSLVISDSGTIISNWRDFILSLAESIPLIGITISLVTVVILLSSIRITFQNTRPKLLSI